MKLPLNRNCVGCMIFVLTILTLTVVFSRPVPALEITPESQFRFAKRYFEKGDHYRAISEFNRFLFHFSGHEKALEARYNIGLCRFRIKEYDEALQAFGSVLENIAGPELSKLEEDAYFMMVDCRIKLESRDAGVGMLEKLIEISPQPAVKDRARYKLMWTHIESGLWKAAHDAALRISPGKRAAYRIDPLADELLKADAAHGKRRWVAGGLSSVIPGLGYVYTNRYNDALTAFLLNGALILAAWESFDEGHEALGGVFSLIELGFYSGTVYGSINAANTYNRNKTRKLIKSIERRYGIVFSGEASGNKVCALFSLPF